MELHWVEQTREYADGTPYRLRSPVVKLLTLEGSPIDPVLISLRIPQPVFGAGLLEAVPASRILAAADPDDADGDGISGRPNLVWDQEQQRLVLGRFGWKANTPNLRQQTAAAYANDMGVTNPLFPAADGSQDIDEATLQATTVYVQTLAVPGRALWQDPQVQRGEKLFVQAQCAKCHRPELQTGIHEIPALANQVIHPYTDLLLHDMGEGLADGRADFEATGREWRTPPLWGIGLSQTVLPSSGYLHDGRARSLEEAILWHGGEAERSREIPARSLKIWLLKTEKPCSIFFDPSRALPISAAGSRKLWRSNQSGVSCPIPETSAAAQSVNQRGSRVLADP